MMGDNDRFLFVLVVVVSVFPPAVAFLGLCSSATDGVLLFFLVIFPFLVLTLRTITVINLLLCRIKALDAADIILLTPEHDLPTN
jgi:hypothetical protein